MSPRPTSSRREGVAGRMVIYRIGASSCVLHPSLRRGTSRCAAPSVLSADSMTPVATFPAFGLPPLALAIQEQIDQICVEFEDLWKTGRRPALQSFLERIEPPARDALFRELLLLDLWYRQKRGEQPAAVDYLEPFPHDAAIIEVVFRDASPEASAADDAPPGLASVSLADAHGKSLGDNQPAGFVTLSDFIESLVRSKLMTRAEIDAFIAGLPREVAPADGRDLANELARTGKLTRLQLQAVYQGKTGQIWYLASM